MQGAGGLHIDFVYTSDWYTKRIGPAKFDAQAGGGVGHFRDHKIARRQDFFRVDGLSIMRKDEGVIRLVEFFLQWFVQLLLEVVC